MGFVDKGGDCKRVIMSDKENEWDVKGVPRLIKQ